MLIGIIQADPDLSNPTRWREERPLDTIRAFEAAIEGSYRSSMINSGGNYHMSLPILSTMPNQLLEKSVPFSMETLALISSYSPK